MSYGDLTFLQVVDIATESGDDFDIPLVFTVGFYPTYVPQNITGWTLYFYVKNYQSDPDSAAVLIQVVTQHLDAAGGLSYIHNPASQTAALLGWYYYYLIWVDNFGYTQTFMKGKINFGN
jgi:hypothetical protein